MQHIQRDHTGAAGKIPVVIPVAEAQSDLYEIWSVLSGDGGPEGAELIIVVNAQEVAPSVAALGSPPNSIIHMPEPKSPYSARNRGLEVAGTGAVAFLDATCVPREDWLEKGIKALTAGGDVVAGRVEFRFENSEPTAAELWDSVTNIQQRAAVERGVAKTASLFVSARARELLGPFREGVRSGEDVRWTGRCSALGLNLVYVDDVVVLKRARRLVPLLRKCLRTGAGKTGSMTFAKQVAKGIGCLIVPPSPWAVVGLVEARGGCKPSAWLAVRVWGVAWAARVFHGVGLLLPSLSMHAD